MKIKTRTMSYDKVLTLPKAEYFSPQKPSALLRALAFSLGRGELKDAGFSYTAQGLDQVKGVPCLILMNHSSFIDLKIASHIFRDRPYNIVCTSDGFVGKRMLMAKLGCIPTQKFVSDITLIRDIRYALKKLGTSVLMYPEASYSFDGCPTPLPRHFGKLLKILDVPVISVLTDGAFLHDPLYNCLQTRKVKVSAEAKLLLTREQIAEKSVDELDAILDVLFSFDAFASQIKNRVRVDEPFRADGLSRILYRCPVCGAEGESEGKGTAITCGACGKTHVLGEYGELSSPGGDPSFPTVSDWYRWERAQVRSEIENGTYRLETDVKIGMMVDYKAIYMVGGGHLVHDCTGFRLTGCGGKLDYRQSPLSSYSLYSDYYWYELGDVICIGGGGTLYYCFPEKKDVVAKARIAAEELYKLRKSAVTAR